MKRIYFFIALLGLFAGQAMASKLWIDDFSIKAGETKEVPIYLTMDSEEQYVAFQFDMYLPEKVEVAKNASGNLRFILQSNRILVDEETFERSHTLTSNYADGYYTVLVSSTTNAYIQKTEGIIIKMYVTAYEDVTIGKYEAQLKNVMLSKITATSDDTAEEPFNITVNKDTSMSLGKNGYSTYCGNYNFSVEGAEAYTASYNGTGSVNLSKIADNAIIEAGTGIILKGNEGDNVTLHLTSEDGDAMLSVNDLIGVNAETTSISPDPYVLASNGTKTAFVKAGSYNTVSLLMNKAYMSIPQGANSIGISFDDATAITSTAASVTDDDVKKYVTENGRLIIESNGTKYNATGKQMK